MYLPKVAEPFDKLSGVILVELYIREINFQDSRTWVAYVEEHELGFTQVHWSKCAGVNTRLNVKDSLTTTVQKLNIMTYMSQWL